jgi:hypothetical protein
MLIERYFEGNTFGARTWFGGKTIQYIVDNMDLELFLYFPHYA